MKRKRNREKTLSSLTHLIKFTVKKLQYTLTYKTPSVQVTKTVSVTANIDSEFILTQILKSISNCNTDHLSITSRPLKDLCRLCDFKTAPQ